jgi:molecular chaperone GrpE
LETEKKKPKIHPRKENKIDKKQNEEIKKLQDETKTLNDKLLRVMAEMQNTKRRNEEERSKLLQFDGEDVIKKLLPVVDNFERAIKEDDDNLTDELSRFLEGFKMIYGSILNIFKEKNVEVIECIGKEFDPNTMEAVLTDHIEDKDPGIVIDCMQKGYTYNGKVIRVAMVKVNE